MGRVSLDDGISPIFYYYWTHFGNFFYTTHYTYIGTKLGLTGVTKLSWQKPYFIMTQKIPNSVIFPMYFTTNLPRDMIANAIYASKQFFEFLPIYPIIIAIFVKNRKKIYQKNKKKKYIGLVILITFVYGISILLYPSVKMRHFLSLFGLLLVITSYVLTFIKLKYAHFLQYGMLIFTCVMAIITYFRNPYHTYYAGGVVMEDQFRQRAEVRTMNKISRMETMSKFVPKDGAVSTEFDRAYFIDNDVLYLSPFTAANPQEVIDTYNLKYLWQDKALPQQIIDQYPSIKLIKKLDGEYLYQL